MNTYTPEQLSNALTYADLVTPPIHAPGYLPTPLAAANTAARKFIHAADYLLGGEFTMAELKDVGTLLWQTELDQRNFYRTWVNSELIEPTGEQTSGRQGRPAQLYRLTPSARTTGRGKNEHKPHWVKVVA